jgi:RNA polymerase sigma factor (sigma-70 family)
MLHLHLVDESGKPLDERICRAVIELEPVFRSRFPAIRDEAIIADLLERTGRRIAEYESTYGPVRKMRAFASETLFNFVTSSFRSSDNRVNGTAVHSERIISELRSAEDAALVENRIFATEVLAGELDAREREIWLLRVAGFTSREIAAAEHLSVANVDKIYSRVRATLRQLGLKWRREGGNA